MSRDSDGFLSRWARRKAEVQALEAQVPAPAEAAPVEPELVEDFDVSTLPSIESLTAQSDITAFMQRGVPEALRTAAVQRMWVTDPAIRDYIGLSEMSWDFNAPGSLYGFGDLAPDMDISKFVAQITDGPTPPMPETEAEVAEALPVSESEANAPVRLAEATPRTPADDEQAEALTDTVAEPMVELMAAPAKRRHGGAIPR